jgi:hypothetical protein
LKDVKGCRKELEAAKKEILKNEIVIKKSKLSEKADKEILVLNICKDLVNL